MTDPMIFNERLELEEDVAAELEDFALLVRLGMYDEAYQHLDTILWNHLDQYAVFAEVAQFLIGRSDTVRQAALIAKGHELEDTRDYDQDLLYDFLGFAVKDGRRAIVEPDPDFKEFDSTIKLQHQDTAFAHYHRTCQNPIYFLSLAKPYIVQLMERDLAWEAVRVFSMICANAVFNSWYHDEYLVHDLYTSLIQWLWKPKPTTHGVDSDQALDFLTCLIRVDLAWLTYWTTAVSVRNNDKGNGTQDLPMIWSDDTRFSKPYGRLSMSFEEAMQRLRCSKPRGHIWKFLQQCGEAIEKSGKAVKQTPQLGNMDNFPPETLQRQDNEARNKKTSYQRDIISRKEGDGQQQQQQWQRSAKMRCGACRQAKVKCVGQGLYSCVRCVERGYEICEPKFLDPFAPIRGRQAEAHGGFPFQASLPSETSSQNYRSMSYLDAERPASTNAYDSYTSRSDRASTWSLPTSLINPLFGRTDDPNPSDPSNPFDSDPSMTEFLGQADQDRLVRDPSRRSRHKPPPPR